MNTMKMYIQVDIYNAQYKDILCHELMFYEMHALVSF